MIEYIKDMNKEIVAKTKTPKAVKSDRIDDPSVAESKSDLIKCTTAVLSSYCKDHSLKVAGEKKDLIDRVWRHIQDKSSDDDLKTRKARKVKSEKHKCCGKNIDGKPCRAWASHHVDDKWLCWRHTESSPSDSSSESESESESEPESVSSRKASKKTSKKK
jgi:hypothetical protein